MTNNTYTITMQMIHRFVVGTTVVEKQRRHYDGEFMKLFYEVLP